MFRLLSIEYFKLKNTTYFWVLTGMFAFFLALIPIGVFYIMDRFGLEQIANLDFSLKDVPFFDFLDVWQNLTWIYTLFSVLLGFVVIINTCNEFSNTTFRQNIIDGLSRKQYFYSKLSFIVVISLLTSLVVLIVGLVFGFSFSRVTDFSFIVKHIEFIPAYFLHLVTFLLFCFVIALLIKKSGMAISFLLFYMFAEFIGTNILNHAYGHDILVKFFPINAIGSIIQNPFPKYILRETQTTVAWTDLGITLIYTIGCYLLAQYLVTKKDV